MLCLTQPTDPAWVERALTALDALIIDHAHCEVKAASSALSLAARCDDYETIRALIAIAEEEMAHYRRVLDVMEQRGIVPSAPPPDAYAGAVRKLVSSNAVRRSKGDSLSDRFLAAALIEARSCERFRLLAEALAGRDDDLADFFRELFEVEARHYRTFVDLAKRARGDDAATAARLEQLAQQEGRLAQTLGVQPTMHG